MPGQGCVEGFTGFTRINTTGCCFLAVTKSLVEVEHDTYVFGVMGRAWGKDFLGQPK